MRAVDGICKVLAWPPPIWTVGAVRLWRTNWSTQRADPSNGVFAGEENPLIGDLVKC